MRISILCSSPEHPVNAWLARWKRAHEPDHDIDIVASKDMLRGGELLFLVSCSEIIRAAERNKYRKCLVIHASDLPQGRGWSPHVWQILEGRDCITVSLLEAEDKVDTGHIWHKLRLKIPPHFLHDEINQALFDAELELMDFAVRHFATITPSSQSADEAPSWYPKRSPEDSRLDPNRSIAEQFDLIRVCDPARFPAFFELHGHRFKITVEKMS